MTHEDKPDAIVGERWQVVRSLDKGGMGAVFEVRHVEIGKRAALKRILPQYQSDDEYVARFEREGRLAGRLKHPNIVQIHDGGEDRGRFLVFDLLEGETVAARLKREVMPPTVAVRVMLELLDALAHVHAQGVVHRDVKPANVFLDRSGGEGEVARLMDFGIASFIDEPPTGLDPLEITRTGRVPGSFPYMSPEQYQGVLPLDGRTDLWAAGVTFYRMLAGEAPSPIDKLHAVLSSRLDVPFPAVSTRVSGLPAALDAFFVKALRHDRDARFQSASEMSRALREIFSEVAHVAVSARVESRTDPSSPPDARKRSPRAGVLAALALFALAFVVGRWWFGRRSVVADSFRPATATLARTPPSPAPATHPTAHATNSAPSTEAPTIRVPSPSVPSPRATVFVASPVATASPAKPGSTARVVSARPPSPPLPSLGASLPPDPVASPSSDCNGPHPDLNCGR